MKNGRKQTPIRWQETSNKGPYSHVKPSERVNQLSDDRIYIRNNQIRSSSSYRYQHMWLSHENATRDKVHPTSNGTRHTLF